MALENLDQKRAKFAWDCANRTKTDDYTNSVKKLLPMIQANGLIAALTYIKGESQNQIYKDLLHWFTSMEQLPQNTDLIWHLVNQRSKSVMQFTSETVKVLGWIKRMSDAVSKD